jgi:uncharacterized protein YdiU (UPF0061 family)
LRPCASNATTRTVFSSIDHAGRYAYGNQPAIAQWNLARFAETLLPLVDSDQEKAIALALEALGEYPALFERYWLAGMRKKLGLQTEEAGDVELIHAARLMQKSRADFTNVPRPVIGGAAGRRLVSGPRLPGLVPMAASTSRDGQASPSSVYAEMRSVNPAVIPRNHRVEEALSAAEDHDDLSVLHGLLAALASPYDAQADSARYQESPPNDCDYRTFCGT